MLHNSRKIVRLIFPLDAASSVVRRARGMRNALKSNEVTCDTRQAIRSKSFYYTYLFICQRYFPATEYYSPFYLFGWIRVNTPPNTRVVYKNRQSEQTSNSKFHGSAVRGTSALLVTTNTKRAPVILKHSVFAGAAEPYGKSCVFMWIFIARRRSGKNIFYLVRRCNEMCVMRINESNGRTDGRGEYLYMVCVYRNSN